MNFTARQAADAVRKLFPTANIDLGPGTEPWTKFTAVRGPLAGTRLLADTGFSPTHSLEDGIAAYAAWMQANPVALV